MAQHKNDVAVVDIDAGNHVTDSMFKYGMHVIEFRALPRIEDGLKPVQRFIVWAAHDIKATRLMKSARLVGGILGEWHPHGDASVYDAMVHMTHDKYSLLEGHGNFGRPPNIPCASQRYTEVKLSDLAEVLVTGTPDLSVVKTARNYDDRRDYPIYLPIRLPLVILNGAEGIAVAATCRIPPHNLKEVLNALYSYLKNGDMGSALKNIKGPDYKCGRLLSSPGQVMSVYEHGEGTLEYECLFTKGVDSSGAHKLVINGFYPGFDPDNFLKLCEKWQEDELIDYVNNETCDANGDRIVIVYDREEVFNKTILPKLRTKINYKFNLLLPSEKDESEVKFASLNMGAILSKWVDLRKNVIRLTLEDQKKQLLKDVEREDFKLIAFANLKKIFEALNSSEPLAKALVAIGLTPAQAEFVMAMKVESLQKLNAEKAEQAKAKLLEEINILDGKLADVGGVLVSQLKEIEKWVTKNDPSLMERKTLI